MLLASLAIGCGDELAIYESLGPRDEARAWLSTNANPHPLASNRFEVNAREARREGFEPERDRGERHLYFWWD